MIRHPAVAGMFYESDRDRLAAQLRALHPKHSPETVTAVAVMVPHAGYVFSGKTAAKVYASVHPAEIYFLLGPNHSGRGGSVALAESGEWETPLGRVTVDESMSAALTGLCPFAVRDDRAHVREHALEVQLPFLQNMGNPFSIIPISLGTHSLAKLEALGKVIAQLMGTSAKSCMLVASSDMNHFESLDETKRLDHMALDPLLAMQPEKLLDRVLENDISMCGVAPAVVMLFAAKILGAHKTELVDYSTSADASGDKSRVVGYAGVRISRHETNE